MRVTCLYGIVAASFAVVLAVEQEYEREARQAPIFFQGGLVPQRGLPPRPGYPSSTASIPRFSTFGGAQPQAFRAPPPQVAEEEEDDEVETNSLSPSPSPLPQQILHYRQSQAPPQFQQVRPTSPLPPVLQQPITSAQILQPQQTLAFKQRPEFEPQPQQYVRRPAPPPSRNHPSNQPLSQEEDVEEKEEPDRLTQLLPQSKFNCNGKKTGYYADDGLNCEVFHYCQDNAKHSWICPEGFSFHQVHLICMPPSQENICQQSTQFHFVNDFLYRPVNAEEAQSRPNVTIRYADRYYPENYYETFGEEDNNGDRSFQHRQPVIQASSPSPRGKQPPAHYQPTLRPLAQLPPQHYTRQPIFQTQEEVSIPLQGRRAPPSSGLHRPSPPHVLEFENE